MSATLELIDTGAGKLRFAAGRATIGAHDAVWVEPYPMWLGVPARLGGPAASRQRPSLLRYTSDDFMERVLSELQSAGALPEAALKAGEHTVKFFQPFHGNFALAAASLVCHVPGHPDRQVDPVKTESVWFVIRRVRRPSLNGAYIEEAWVPGANSGWVNAGTPTAPLPVALEQRLPLVRLRALNHRSVWVGYIPVASNETFKANRNDPLSAVSDAETAFAGIVSRLQWIQNTQGRSISTGILDTLEVALRDSLKGAYKALTGIDNGTTPSIWDHKVANWLKNANNFVPFSGTWADALAVVRAQPATTAYDLARLPSSAISGSDGLVMLLQDAALANESSLQPRDHASTDYTVILARAEQIKSAYQILRSERLTESLAWVQSLAGNPAGNAGWIGSFLPEVALAIRAQKDPLARKGVSAEGPAYDFYHGIETLQLRQQPLLNRLSDAPGATVPHVDYEVTEFAAAPFAALWTHAESALSGAVLPKYPVDAIDQGVHFVVRCALEHGCRAPVRVLFSNASEPWVPASVFDPGAPARQMRVPMPFNLDAAKLANPMGLGFMLSKELRKQMGAVHKGMLKGDGPGSPPSIDMGAICTFSIPIVTICALILLLIMVSILDYVFRWLPYFVVCYPLKLMGKPKPPEQP